MKKDASVRYTDEERRMALARLALNDGDYDKTGEELGISGRTLRRWATTDEDPSVPELLDRVVSQHLINGPSEGMRPREWAEVVGLLLDKWMLIHDRPTSKMETLFRTLEDMDEDDLDRVILRLAETEASFGSGKRRKGKAAENSEDSGGLGIPVEEAVALDV